jgi:hypothetical protein
VDERGQRVMGFGLGLPVQIETGVDWVEAALQPFGTGPIDPRNLLLGHWPNRLPSVPFLDLRRRC